MLDFLIISTRRTKSGVVEIFPKFKVGKSKDLMIRGGDFYAIWNAETNLWCTEEESVIRMIDQELDEFREANKAHTDESIKTLYMWDSDSGMIDKFHKYCQKQLRDSFHALDSHLIFANTATKKTDYASKKLPYSLEPCDISAYEELISRLYSPEERRKIEWAIGAIISGDSVNIQKFLVMYGAAGTGKSTILNIIQKLFEGYYAVFDAKALGNPNNTFALEPFKTNPLVAIQHDGDLSHIEDNTRLNSVVSHELMTVNEKFKTAYSNQFRSFLFMGTNRPVKITDAKSGIIRRLIDVSPTGDKIPLAKYEKLIKEIDFELGGIACHCLDVYKEDPDYYNGYIPTRMIGASNDFYNFILDAYDEFSKTDGTTLLYAWSLYKRYCEDANIGYPYTRRVFAEELKNYFETFEERRRSEDGTRVRNYYSGFLKNKFIGYLDDEEDIMPAPISLFEFNSDRSLFDKICADCPAQYANENGTPLKKWDEVKTTLKDLDTSKLHYVQVPETHIIVDFDICDEDGNKSFEKNLEAASKWPLTYAELSKSGQGIHLHYIYTGDPSMVSRVYADNVEIKVFTGNSSLRRKLTKCNDQPIVTISSGLPMKGVKKVVNQNIIKSEKGLRALIAKNLRKEVHPGTKPSIDFIFKILSDAYESGMTYDVSDMYQAVLGFANGSTHQAQYCVKMVGKMKFKSDEPFENTEDYDIQDLCFFDVEVFPNFFGLVYKFRGKEKVKWKNPSPEAVQSLFKYKLIGFNNRKYDNHIIYARGEYGFNNKQLYELSQKIINNREGFFGEAYNLSYTDIYDFASAGNKMSLKALELEMGIRHMELGLPWDQDVPEELWDKVMEYCGVDVDATEKAFDYLKADWTSRQILADLAGMTVNDTTNTLTTRIIFGKNRRPQSDFQYRNLAEPVFDLDETTYLFLAEACPEMMQMTHGPAGSLLPYFPGYEYSFGKSTYRGITVGEGGYVYSEPGYYENVALLDVSSMHPHSTIAEVLFGVVYTKIYRDIVEGRVAIKHEDWDTVRRILDGKLAPYVELILKGELTAKELADGLKTAINSVYGLTAAKFDNAFNDPRNVDNIVAKRGALFMVDLENAVRDLGYIPAHIKTDSIKIPNATPEIIDFVMKFGKQYGYTFEHEDTYAKICLVNKAVYIAKYQTPHKNKVTGKDIWWTATGAQFQVPYVFKTLFSHEPIVFEDLCEIKAVQTAIYIDMNEHLPEGEHNYIFVGKTGIFCPMKPGTGGGELVREKNGKYDAVSGTKGYRWMEAEMVETLGKQDDIDRSYYNNLVDEAVDAISQYVDFNEFVS